MVAMNGSHLRYDPVTWFKQCFLAVHFLAICSEMRGGFRGRLGHRNRDVHALDLPVLQDARCNNFSQCTPVVMFFLHAVLSP